MKCMELYIREGDEQMKDITSAAQKIRDHASEQSDMIFLLRSPGNKVRLFKFIDEMYELNPDDDDMMYNLRLCYALEDLDLEYTPPGGSRKRIRTMQELIRNLNDRGGQIVIMNNDRVQQAEVSQQLAYIGYPLETLDILLKDELKDKDRTDRFMKEVDGLSDAVARAMRELDSRDFACDSTSLPQGRADGLRRTVDTAKSACKEIADKIAKAQDLELKVAVVATKKTGKSVIVNCMIKQEIAPTSLTKATPNTCVYTKSHDMLYHLSPTRIGTSNTESPEAPSTFLTLPQGRSDYPDRNAIFDALRREFQAAETSTETDFATADMKIEYVSKQTGPFETFRVYDTPGPDLAGAGHVASANAALCESDVVIFAFDFTKYLTDTEEEYLQRVAKLFHDSGKYATLLFTVNKTDQQFTNAGESKSPIRIVDFIRTRLIELGKKTDCPDLYRKCVIFATSSLQFFNTMHCEQELKLMKDQGRIGVDLAQDQDLPDLLKMAGDVKRAGNKVVSGELLFLNGIVGHYRVELGMDKVTPEILKKQSGMPSLLDYTSYICKSKARQEIVNSITSRIDTMAGRLNEIRNQPKNITVLLDAGKEKLARISKIIDDYKKETSKVLTDSFSAEEVNAVPGPNYLQLMMNSACSLTWKRIKEWLKSNLKADMTKMTLNEFADEVSDSYVAQSYEEVKNLVETRKEKHYDRDVIKRSDLDPILQAATDSSYLHDSVDKVGAEKIGDVKGEAKDLIDALGDNIRYVLNKRLEKLQAASDRCQQRLNKEEAQLIVPTIPSFSFAFPEFVFASVAEDVRDLHIAREDLGKKLTKKMSGWDRFKKGWYDFWRGKGVKEYIYVDNLINDKYKKELKESIKEDLQNALKEAKTLDNLKQQLEELWQRTEPVLQDMEKDARDLIDALEANIDLFTQTVDDTEFYRQNIAAFEAQKKTAEEIGACCDDFLTRWDAIAQDVVRTKETVA